MRFFFQSAMVVCGLFMVSLAVPVLAAEGEVSASPVVTASILSLFLQALGSSAGVTVLAAILAWILGKIFLAKPEWKVIYDRYQPAFMAAVKYAEKVIPNEVNNAGMQRLDLALQKVIQIEAALNSVPTSILTQVMNMVHAEAEAKGNI